MPARRRAATDSPRTVESGRYWLAQLRCRGTLFILAEMLLGVVLTLLAVWFYAELTEEVLQNEVHLLDVMISQLVYSWRTPELTQAMFLITELGSGLSIVTASAISVVLLLRRHKKEAVLFSLAVIIGIFLNSFLKLMIARPRPELSPLVAEVMTSYPSGHAMNAFVFFALLSFFAFHFSRSKFVTFVVSILAVTAVGLIGFSRVYLGVHYLTDVLAGYLAGFGWFVTVLLIDRTFLVFRLFRRSE